MELHFRGSLDKDQFIRIYTLANRPVKPGNAVDLWMIMIGLGLIGMGGGFANLLTTATGPAGIASVTSLTVGAALLLMGWNIGQTVYRMWDTNEMLHIERHGVIDDEGIKMETRYGEARYKWADFSGYGEYKDVIWLALAGEGVPFSPRYFATAADWEIFRAEVHSRLTVSHQVKQLSPRWYIPTNWNLKNAFIYILIAIAVIVIAMNTYRTTAR